MTKYRLKKDLPWMKADTIFWFENENMKIEGSTLLASCYQETKDYFFTNDDGNFDESDFEDCPWIEKIKPRELILHLSVDGRQIKLLKLGSDVIINSIYENGDIKLNFIERM